jgi:putative membrane protein
MTASALVPIGLGGGLMIPLGLTGVALWILLILLIVWLVRGTLTSARAPEAPAIQMLQERYARGEITREEFLERLDVLDGRTTGRRA